MPKSGKKLVEGMTRVLRCPRSRKALWDVSVVWDVCVIVGTRRFIVGTFRSIEDAAREERRTQRMLTAVVNAALKEVGKCQK